MSEFFIYVLLLRHTGKHKCMKDKNILIIIVSFSYIGDILYFLHIIFHIKIKYVYVCNSVFTGSNESS